MLTPAQITALHGLARRQLSPAELDAIGLLLDEGRINAAAVLLSTGRTRVVTRLGGVGVVMETLGPDVGAAVLDGLDALKAHSAPIKWAWVLINRGELDFGSPATRGMIQQLAGQSAIPAAAAAALLSVAEMADPVTDAELERALEAV